MKRIISLIIVTVFICIFGNFTFAEELEFKEKIGYVDPDSGDKLLDREIDDNLLKKHIFAQMGHMLIALDTNGNYWSIKN